MDTPLESWYSPLTPVSTRHRCSPLPRNKGAPLFFLPRPTASVGSSPSTSFVLPARDPQRHAKRKQRENTDRATNPQSVSAVAQPTTSIANVPLATQIWSYFKATIDIAKRSPVLSDPLPPKVSSMPLMSQRKHVKLKPLNVFLPEMPEVLPTHLASVFVACAVAGTLVPGGLDVEMGSVPVAARVMLHPTVIEGSSEHNDGVYGGTSCHQCKTRLPRSVLVYCTTANTEQRRKRTRDCRKKYCQKCLRSFYQTVNIPPDWMCPGCCDVCSCAECKRKRGRSPGGVGLGPVTLAGGSGC